MGRWWYPQKTVAICAENIGNVFWEQNILGLCSWCVATKTDPWLAFFRYISELFDGYQTILETPQNVLRNPQNFRRSLQIFLRNRQIFLRILILKLFEDPQNFLGIVTLRIFWGSSLKMRSEKKVKKTFEKMWENAEKIENVKNCGKIEKRGKMGTQGNWKVPVSQLHFPFFLDIGFSQVFFETQC